MRAAQRRLPKIYRLPRCAWHRHGHREIQASQRKLPFGYKGDFRRSHQLPLFSLAQSLHSFCSRDLVTIWELLAAIAEFWNSSRVEHV